MQDYRPSICPICRNENVRNTISNVSASSSTEAQNIEYDENRRNLLSSQYEGNEHYKVNEPYERNGNSEGENEVVNEEGSENGNEHEDENDEAENESNGESTANIRIDQKVQEFINEITNPDIDEMETDEEDEMEMEEEMSDNGQTISLQMLLHLYDHACKAEKKKIKIKREIIKWWYKYGENFERKLTEIVSSNRISKKKATTRLYDELERLRPGVSRDNLRKRTEKSTKVYFLFLHIGVEKIQHISKFSADKISKFTWNQIHFIVDHFNQQ
ncbi:23911_t:CDS:1 [Dentiscutata erythropus]|uniref:23911_t:CDS:1 n=1 Tax=Dentiscutata erythropus TaxID=1348616 RepID=A0A9N9I2X1_9GLOM|nr:23911_t:CDS:1 [Dentiscutata erythropus]